MNIFWLEINQGHIAKRLIWKVQMNSFWPLFLFIFSLDVFHKIFPFFIYFSEDNFAYHLLAFNSAAFFYLILSHNQKIFFRCYFDFLLNENYFFSNYQLFWFFSSKLISRFGDSFLQLKMRL